MAACTDDSINGDGGNPAIKGSILNDTRPDDGVKQGAINTDPMKPVVENGDKFVLNVTKPVSGADNPKEESKTTEQSKTIEHGDDEISDNGGSLLDTPQVLDDDAVEDDSYYKVHTLRLLMYIVSTIQLRNLYLKVIGSISLNITFTIVGDSVTFRLLLLEIV